MISPQRLSSIAIYLVLLLFTMVSFTNASLYNDRFKNIQDGSKQRIDDEISDTISSPEDHSICESIIEKKTIIQNGSEVSLSSFPSRIEEGHTISVLDENKYLYYVHSFLSQDEANTMGTFCGDSNRFQRSPQTGVEDLNGNENQARTSSSCPLLFAYFYIPKLDDVKSKAPKLAEELILTWDITQRAARLVGVDEAHFEPFQLLKYSPGEFYKEHHDHRGYYDPVTGYPDRPITILLFLNDVSEGGELKFEKLGLEFKPRIGDAVIWSNVDSDGLADPDMVHEAKPPKKGMKMGVNVWIREKPFTDMRQASMRQH